MNTDDPARVVLLSVARAAIEEAIRGTPRLPPPDTAILQEERGVFVTLRRGGRLRGCIGRVEPDSRLGQVLPEVAVLSATSDPRFPAVSVDELTGLSIEISLLTRPILITGPAGIEIGRHGLMVSAGGRRGLLLPQVASEYGWTAPEFLSQTCVKASLRADAWQHHGARIHTFETEIFGED